MQIKVAALLALLPSLVYAVPASVTGQKPSLRIPLQKRTGLTKNGLVNIEALKSHRTRLQAKISNGFMHYERNTGNPHPNFNTTSSVSIAKRQEGSTQPQASANGSGTGLISLTDEEDGQLWQGEITVGTPPVTYTVDFDTGSSDLFLPSTSCDASCQGHKGYDASASSTAVDQQQSFELAFGDGSSVSGDIVTDTVGLANFTVPRQPLGAASTYAAGFAAARFPPDGLLGMAFEQISGFGAPSAVQALVSQPAQGGAGEVQVREPLFAVTLLETGAELLIGGDDTQAFVGEIAYAPVTTVGFWQIAFGGISAGTDAGGSTSDKGNNDENVYATTSGGECRRQNTRHSRPSPNQASNSAIVDTGTTLIVGPSSGVEAFYATIPGAQDASQLIGESGFFTVPCSSVAALNISVSVAGRSFAVSSDVFNLGPPEEGSDECVGGVIADDEASNGMWILGDVFLRNVYTSFDFGQTRVGFADLANAQT